MSPCVVDLVLDHQTQGPGRQGREDQLRNLSPPQSLDLRIVHGHKGVVALPAVVHKLLGEWLMATFRRQS